MNHNQYYVYILTNRSNKTLYIGFTNDLRRRVLEHKKKLVEGFTKKYYLNKLIYFEKYLEMADAQKRERQLKNWHRDWKLNLIKENNSDFQDLSEGWYDDIDKIN
ncbi:GIY-YIG nuclease family protein [candidate division KSB1 bacterium]|nr:GIY-YIG nuclease family protein [candidate division KSB1 bacterium]